MRPVTLTVSGLQSFREEQVVDFQTLTEGGVFGIFGPTGSGKSSLLDAMTLALYGKVERAANNTYGIINHAEDMLKVSFTFELGNANGKSRYKVERTFKRTDEMRVKTAVSRLVDINEETVVLADKTNDVNQKIQDILGLTIDDFTRAVVLPQGKFAEFLSLKGSDRRQMLQRLFNLEQYGDKLTKKLRQQLNDTERELDKVQSEMTGLGDASKKAVDEAKERLTVREKELDKSKKELEMCESEHDKKKQLWEWQQEQEKVSKDIQKNENESGEIESLEEKLNKANRAETVKPYIEELETAKELVNRSEHKKNTLFEKYKIVKADYDTVITKYEVAKKNRDEQEPILVNQKNEYEQLLQIANEITAMKNDLSTKKSEYAKVEGDLQAEEQKLQEHSHLLEKARVRQRDLKEELNAVTVTSAHREKVRQANEQKQKVVSLVERQDEAQKEWVESNKKVNDLKEQVNHEKGQYNQFEDKIVSLFRRTENIYQILSERLTEFDKGIRFGDVIYKKKQEQIEKERINYLAHQLALDLTEGESCPVCGSKEHPSPVGALPSENEPGREMLNEIENVIRSTSTEKNEVEKIKLQLEQLSEQLIQALGNASPEPTIQHKQVEPILPQDPVTSFDELKEKLRTLVTEGRAIKQDLIKLIDDGKSSISHLTQIGDRLKQKQYSLHEEEKRLTPLVERKDELTEMVEKEKAQWIETYIEFQYEKVEQEQEKINDADKKAEDFKARIETSVSFIEEKEQEIQSKKDRKNELDKVLIEKKKHYEVIQSEINKKSNVISEKIGSEQPDLLLDQVNKQLQLLKKNEVELYDSWQSLQKLVGEAESESAAANQSFIEAKDRLQVAEEKWTSICKEYQLSSVDEVKKAVQSKKVRDDWKSQIDAFYDRKKQLQNEWNRLSSKIGEQTMTESDWMQVQEQFQQAKLQLSEAQEAKGAAVTALQELQIKHERFNELKKAADEYATKREQLSKLQSALRGNGFVEFIAEEQLMQVTRDASQRLASLTRQRYAIEVDSSGGFIIRDDANGGVKRPVSSLSGGETFLTSLSLALALSAQIQLRGEFPLEFFFLDEGFGTLDHDLLDTVITSLEKLNGERLAVGVISHVQELRARLPRKLIVTPAEPSGKGSRVKLETV